MTGKQIIEDQAYFDLLESQMKTFSAFSNEEVQTIIKYCQKLSRQYTYGSLLWTALNEILNGLNFDEVMLWMKKYDKGGSSDDQ